MNYFLRKEHINRQQIHVQAHRKKSPQIQASKHTVNINLIYLDGKNLIFTSIWIVRY